MQLVEWEETINCQPDLKGKSHFKSALVWYGLELRAGSQTSGSFAGPLT